MLGCRRVALVVVVDRVVPHRDARAVERVAGAEGLRDVPRGESHDAPQAAPFAVVRDEGQQVLRRILVVGEAEVPEAQLVLDEVDEAQRPGFRRLERLLARCVVEADHVQVRVVAVVRPVDEVLATGQPRVVEHLARVHGRLLACRVSAVARRGAVELGRVVALGPRDRPVGPGAVVLQDGAPRQVLDDVARGRDPGVLAGHRVGFEAEIERGARPGQDVAEVRPVHHDPRAHLDPPSRREVFEHRAPHAGSFLHDVDEPVAEEDAQGKLGRRHLLEDAVGHVGLEMGVADPAGADGLGTAVEVVDSLSELPPEARGQAVVAVGGRDAGRREHPPEPRRGLGHDRARAEAGALERGRGAARSPAHDEDVGLELDLRAGVRSGGRQEKGGESHSGGRAHGGLARARPRRSP